MDLPVAAVGLDRPDQYRLLPPADRLQQRRSTTISPDGASISARPTSAPSMFSGVAATAAIRGAYGRRQLARRSCRLRDWNLVRTVHPDLRRRFAGRQLHTTQYRRASDFTGQKVLIVGGRNSAAQSP
jgi:hypothetical protein